VNFSVLLRTWRLGSERLLRNPAPRRSHNCNIGSTDVRRLPRQPKATEIGLMNWPTIRRPATDLHLCRDLVVSEWTRLPPPSQTRALRLSHSRRVSWAVFVTLGAAAFAIDFTAAQSVLRWNEQGYALRRVGACGRRVVVSSQIYHRRSAG